MTNSSQICCPKFDPSTLEGKTHVWKDKLFIKDNVRQLFHIPLNMGQVITRMWNTIENAKAAPDIQDFLMLSFDPSPWTSEIYMTVTKDIPNTQMVKISGTLVSKVFDGPFQEVPHWMKEMETYVAEQGKTVKKQYMYYTTCPKCAKKYGHNYVVAFAQVE